MKLELVTAQLSIVDGAWEESPDNLAVFEEPALFPEGSARGNLYVVIEVAGELEGRDELARQLVETVRREYALGHGSIAGALTDAVRSANEFFYTTNANVPLEARRYAGITVAALREDELFIAQAGPGLVCIVRDNELQRYPDTSPWFMADDDAVNAWLASRDFPTPGAVPVGIRRDYTPDLFHATLQPGDIIVLSTRSLVHLLSNAELLDTLAHHHPDAIVTSLEELAGAADLALIAMRAAGESTPSVETKPQPPILVPVPQESFDVSSLPAWVPPLPDNISPIATAEDMMPQPAPAEPTEEELAHQRKLEEQHAQEEQQRQLELQERVRRREQQEAERKRAQEEQARERRAKIRSGFLRVGAGVTGGLAGVLGHINGTAIGNAADRAIDGVFRGGARLIVFIIRAVTPGEPEEESRRESSSPRSTAWQLASLVLPILLIVAGVLMWVSYRTDQQRIQADQVNQSIANSTQALERAKSLAASDKNGARDAAQNAMTLAQQARNASPNDARASKAFYDAEDFLDGLNGILVLFVQPSFQTFSDPQAKPSRMITHFPDVFIFDSGTQRIYRFAINDAGTSAAPVSGDGVILKAGDKVGDRTVGQLIDMMWIDAGRLIALDRNGVFWKYDPTRSASAWESKPGTDAATWSRVNLATSYAGNLYLIDAPNKQILKYVPNADWWSSPVTFFNPGVNPDFSNVVDMSIDGDVWMLRSTGSILKCSAARCTESTITDLDTPLKKPISVFTSQTLAGLYIADAGNERIVQIDKTTGRFARQFKPYSPDHTAFTALKAFAVDDKRFYFANGTQAYFANIPQ